ncbi:MAG: stage V sporulation protein AE [Clostridia bacterium]|nr:stage V sporulation protein AE [Clostridia bacterium]
MDVFVKYLLAFVIGGAICTIAQILIDKTKLTPARILVIYVCVGVLLTAINVYEPLVKLAGAGATVPLTGFGRLIANGVKKAVDEKGLLGALTGGLGATAGGIAASLVFGFIASLIFSSKPKK